MTTYSIIYENEILTIEQYTANQLNELLDRLRVGNRKLNAAWDQISEQGRPEIAVQKWLAANAKLRAYCAQAIMLGFEDCLYMVDGVKTQLCSWHSLGCRVCPSNIPYWSTELFGEEFGVESEKG